MTQLKIIRLNEWANKRFSYKIFVDGKEQLEIANGQESLLNIEGGSTVQAKIMWCGSKPITLPANDEKIKEILRPIKETKLYWFIMRITKKNPDERLIYF
jgi:hypothetical protein